MVIWRTDLKCELQVCIYGQNSRANEWYAGMWCKQLCRGPPDREKYESAKSNQTPMFPWHPSSTEYHAYAGLSMGEAWLTSARRSMRDAPPQTPLERFRTAMVTLLTFSNPAVNVFDYARLNLMLQMPGELAPTDKKNDPWLTCPPCKPYPTSKITFKGQQNTQEGLDWVI